MNNEKNLNNQIETYSIGVLIQPRPSIILTYSYLEQDDKHRREHLKKRKHLMPVRDLDNLKLDFTKLKDIELFKDIIYNLKQRHEFYLNKIDDLILLKIIIILCCLINNNNLDQSLLYAENLLKTNENRIEDNKIKKEKRHVRFKEDHDEFIFERETDDDELIDDDKYFLDRMLKNESNYEEDLNNNYQTFNYNK